MVSGNLRRTAEIAFGDPDSDEYIDLKNYTKNPQRAAYGWTSNNSVGVLCTDANIILCMLSCRYAVHAVMPCMRWVMSLHTCPGLPFLLS